MVEIINCEIERIIVPEGAAIVSVKTKQFNKIIKECIGDGQIIVYKKNKRRYFYIGTEVSPAVLFEETFDGERQSNIDVV